MFEAGLGEALEGFEKCLEADLSRLEAKTETGFAQIRAEVQVGFAKQTRLHFRTLAFFIFSVWGVLLAQVFV